jgi:hypothetical protein
MIDRVGQRLDGIPGFGIDAWQRRRVLAGTANIRIR